MGQRARRTVTIRWSLIRNVSLLLVFLTAAMLLATVLTGIEIRDALAETRIDRALDGVEAKLHRYLDPVSDGLLFARALVGSGALDLDDPRALRLHFLLWLERFPQLAAAGYGDARGAGWLLLRLPDRWLERRVHAEEWGARQALSEWRDAATLLHEWSEELPAEPFDPRTRDWYRIAQQEALRREPDAELPAGVYWTAPYPFYTSGVPGLTAAVHVRDPRGRRAVVALDVQLAALSDFTQKLEVSEHGFGALLAEDGGLLGLPGLPRFADPSAQAAALLRRPLELGVPEVHDAALAWQALQPDPPPIFPFQSSGTGRACGRSRSGRTAWRARSCSFPSATCWER
jgi:hypothetical protein